MSDDTATLGASFFLMDRIEGETLARRLLRDDLYAEAPRVMTPQLGRILATIHRIDRENHGLSFLAEPPAKAEIDRFEQIFRAITPDPHPTFEIAIRWLRARRRPYEQAGGGAVDPQHVRSWEVLGNLKWGIMTIMQAKTHLDGLVKSVELASLGRRTAEMELELLNLIDE